MVQEETWVEVLSPMAIKLISWLLVAFGFLAIGAFLSRPSEPIQPTESTLRQSGDRIVATVGTHPIVLREIEQAVALPLYQADQQRSQLLHQALQRKIEETLLEAEASRRGVSVSQLLDGASQSESIARLANLPAPVKRLRSDTTQNDRGYDALGDLQEQARIRQALVVSLRRKTDIRITLEDPAPPILPVTIDDDPVIGPIDAPITIVEFSDFQCPYCRKSLNVLKELRQRYRGKIRLVYRDFPGPNHPHASQAAEAAQCAGEQGKFWEYHDLLFDRQTPGQGWDFATLARELGLRQDAFSTCVQTRRYRKEVAKDLQDGITLGITSTPTFFVNGRPLVGARSIAEFQVIIERLLTQQLPS
ncbi:MAG TPA: thioredoxin domain-containing protein [Nitrospira sp.]|nr:thioredoxin domain-containing protein [Nitrospira sp.]